MKRGGFTMISGKNMYSRNSDNRKAKKWYEKTVWIIILLILFFPVGLYLMWRYTNWKKPAKVIISVFIAFVVYSAVTAPGLESVKLQADTATVYDINEQIKIDKNITPESYSLSETAFKTTGGKIKISGNKIFFMSDEPGIFEVYAESSGVKSNTVAFKIEDKAAIAKEKSDKEAAKAKKKEEEAAQKAEEERLAAEAQKKAEEERIATEAAAQAEQERIAAEQAQQQAEFQQPQENMVWISATGSKYHSYSSCGNMNPDNAYQMSQSEAEASGYGRCKKCH